jgi:hypothetical protein
MILAADACGTQSRTEVLSLETNFSAIFTNFSAIYQDKIVLKFFAKKKYEHEIAFSKLLYKKDLAIKIQETNFGNVHLINGKLRSKKAEIAIQFDQNM